jgi:phenylpropionate dioxygenase-like ring-hydroxylating dioxygenase large terminal subunit
MRTQQTSLATPTFDLNLRWGRDVYPELGSGPIPVEPCISEDYFRLEQERIFRRVWLCVGRVEQVPKWGDYFARDIAGRTVFFVRGRDGVVRGFHNICSHRGNKIVWDEAGCSRKLMCKFHGWTFDTEGRLKGVPDEKMFSDLRKSEHGLIPVATDTWEGFIFANLEPNPAQSLSDFLGEYGRRMSGFPYGEMSHCFSYRAELNCNWKIALDAFSEAYHVGVVHRRAFPGQFSGRINPLSHLPEVRLYRYHRSCIVYRNPEFRPPPVAAHISKFRTSPPAGSRRQPGQELPPDVNPTRSRSFAFELTGIFPNILLHITYGNWFTHQFWPVAVDKTTWEGRLHLYPPKNAAELFSLEALNIMTRNAWLEDTGTMEATQAALASGVKKYFVLQDQEILIRHSYKVIEDFVGYYSGNGAATA